MRERGAVADFVIIFMLILIVNIMWTNSMKSVVLERFLPMQYIKESHTTGLLLN